MAQTMTAADFARQVVQRLQAAGFEAVWAGGCVRDRLLGVTPKDYDIATDATPEDVRQLFGRRRTLLIGVSFGVVTVLAPKPLEPVEVATFRRDEDYTDGRRPDRVHFCSAAEDAKRRDFTVNGLFFDPISKQVIDYVDGQADLRQQLIRCIGNPHERIREDKLRMLRAIRFSGTLNFTIDPATMKAIADHADELHVVSAERITAEMRRILVHENTPTSLEQLRQTGLWKSVLPEYAERTEPDRTTCWSALIRLFEVLIPPRNVTTAMAALLYPIVQHRSVQAVHELASRWRLSNRERDDSRWMLDHADTILHADQIAWPRLQPVLVHPLIESLLTLADAIYASDRTKTLSLAGIETCRKKLSLPPDQLNPKPLVNGHDLINAGIPNGKQLGTLLQEIRDAQLNGQLADSAEAVAWAKSRFDRS